MTRQEYEQKRAECWEELKRTHLDGEVQWQPVNRYDVFCAAFDRAYALGKQEKDAEGRHNLTFDAEGEEILTCEKSKAMQLYSHLLDLVENERISEHYSEWCDLEREYIALFGENVFADYFGSKCLPDAREVNFASKKPQPAEPKENANKHLDNILKGSFMEHNRLHIAAMIMSGLLASGKEKHHPVRRALDLADALIAECEKEGDNA